MVPMGSVFSIQILLLILLGFWGKSIAERKGYNGLVGFLVGFFGTLLGILILLLLPYFSAKKNTVNNIKTIEKPKKYPDYKPVEYSKTGDTTSYFCPHCFQEVKIYEGYNLYECPHCNGKFTL